MSPVATSPPCLVKFLPRELEGALHAIAGATFDCLLTYRYLLMFFQRGETLMLALGLSHCYEINSTTAGLLPFTPSN